MTFHFPDENIETIINRRLYMFATSILGYTVTAIWYIFVAVLSIIVALWPAMIAKRQKQS